MNGFLETLAGGKVLICDGGMGTFLHKEGLRPGECPELWCVEHAEKVKAIHQSYREAGSHLVECNSFGGSRYKLREYELEDRVEEINRCAAEVAREVAGADQFVLGSIGPTGEFMEPLGEEPEEAFYAAFSEQAKALETGGADCVIVETMTALEEGMTAVRAVKENTDLAVVVSFTFDPLSTGGYATMMGVRPEAFAQAAVEAGADVIGSNCGIGSEHMLNIVKLLRTAAPGIPIMAMPNAGMPVVENGQTVFKETPGDMAGAVPRLLEAGATILGGCCGTGPDHIAAMRAAVPTERLAEW